MTKEFIPYNEALALKELGFDEPCFGFWSSKNSYRRFINDSSTNIDLKNMFGDEAKEAPTAPTFSQAFRWFREKYNLDGSLSVDVWNTKKVSWRITGGIKGKIFVNREKELYDYESDEYDTYEEAELECLKKLIEIAQKR